MSAHQSPPFIRRRLGQTFRVLRKQAGMFKDACERLEISAGRMSRLENGETAPDIPLAKTLLDLYGITVNDWEPYLELAREARKKGWWQHYGVAARVYIALETACSKKRNFELEVVPGLLQTEDYARAMFAVQSSTRSSQWIDSAVDVRMLRQQRLTDHDDTFELTAILDEGVLSRQVGSVEIMRAQLHHLVEQSKLANVTLQIVPRSAGPHLGTLGAFSVLSFPDEDDPDIVHVDTVAGSVFLEKEDQVRAVTIAFEGIRREALNPAESALFIARLADAM